MERNRVQIEVKDRVERSKAYSAVERAISRNLQSWQDWESHGYASAFNDAWRSGMRDIDAIVTYVIAVAGTKSAIKKTL
jgi:hypothetical protein